MPEYEIKISEALSGLIENFGTKEKVFNFLMYCKIHRKSYLSEDNQEDMEFVSELCRITGNESYTLDYVNDLIDGILRSIGFDLIQVETPESEVEIKLTEEELEEFDIEDWEISWATTIQEDDRYSDPDEDDG